MNKLFGEKLVALSLFLTVPILYPIYIMSNLQKYNGSNRAWTKNKKSKSKKQLNNNYPQKFKL